MELESFLSLREKVKVVSECKSFRGESTEGDFLSSTGAYQIVVAFLRVFPIGNYYKG